MCSFFVADEKVITGIELHITNEYLQGTYNSCKHVSVPSTGQLALDIMCGDWGAARCSANKWFQYMGNADGNPFVPFQITYKNSSEPVGPYVPINPKIIPCSQAPNVSITLCFLGIV